MADPIIMAPQWILLLSGKRKAGKDFVAEQLKNRIGSEKVVIIRLSGPLKRCYADNHGLDLKELLAASPYKEQFRNDMVVWGESMRMNDSGYFCRHAIAEVNADSFPIWIVSDCRRPTDIEFFIQTYQQHSAHILKIRIESSIETRKSRGWEFTAGIDDAETECALDSGIEWDIVISNDSVDCAPNLDSIFAVIK